MYKLWQRMVFLIGIVAIALLVASCAASAPPEIGEPDQLAPPPQVAEREGAPAPPEPEEPPDAAIATPVAFIRSQTGARLAAGRPRLIIKNAEIKLQVSDTEVAIDRVTQVVDDVGGYIISSRVWHDQFGDKNYKYASITMGVPVDDFERALRRLRELAIIVLDENASGEDVTDEFVDLESRLRNLETTRDRIREFMQAAETVEEALNVNEELTKVEADIEQVQGRINYLFDRASFSTITVLIEPEILELTPTPTPTITPTPTPVPWNASNTYREASSTLNTLLRGLADASIWIGVVVLPICLPAILIVWAVVLLARKFRMRNFLSKPQPKPVAESESTD